MEHQKLSQRDHLVPGNFCFLLYNLTRLPAMQLSLNIKQMVGQEGPSVYIQHVVSVTPYQLFWNCLVMCVICKASLSLHWCWVQGASMWNQMARCMPVSSLSWMLVRMDWCQLGCSQAYTWLFDFSHYLLVSNILDHVVGWNSIILQLVIIIELEE